MVDTATGTGDLHRTVEGDDAATYAALVMGTRDYVRKCGFKQALIGLSGGIDSALVAAIAVDALGKENVIGVGMPSPYSSQGSIDDSRALASNLGIAYETIRIDGIFSQFTEALAPLFAGRAPDVTEENIQSRIRGTLLMALSNKLGALVLTTGNKSEMAVGYCTLYGDMVGALAVIGDLVKTRVYALSRYVNREREVIPRAILEKAPSAELRPGQLDTDSLPPYERAGSVGGGVRGALHADAGDCRSAGTGSGAGAEGREADRAERVQAAAGGAGAEGDGEVVWKRAAVPDCSESTGLSFGGLEKRLDDYAFCAAA